MADILMPITFPQADFRAFGTAATAFFPAVAVMKPCSTRKRSPSTT